MVKEGKGEEAAEVEAIVTIIKEMIKSKMISIHLKIQ